MQTIGERITYLREMHNISQRELSNTLQVTPATLSRYENNLYEPKATIIIRLCDALNTTSDFLLGLTNLPFRVQTNTPDDLSKSEIRSIRYYHDLNNDNKARVEERILALYELENKN